MGRTKVRWDRITVLTALVGAILWAAAGAVGGAGPPPQHYLVQRGDTLWDIARGRVGPEGDPRPLIAEIRKVNGLATGAIPAGRTLVIPGG